MNEIQISKIESSGSRAAQDKISVAEISRSKLDKVCCEFEQIFIKYLIDRMWSSIEAAGDKIPGERAVYQDMLNGEIAKEISKNSDLGIAAMISRQLSAAYYAGASEKTPDK